MADAFTPVDEDQGSGGGKLSTPGHVMPAKGNKYAVAASRGTGGTQRDGLLGMPPRKVLHLLHRFAVFLLALVIVAMAFDASFAAMLLLRGHDNPWMEPTDDMLPLVAGFLGNATIRQSPLVVDFLKNSTVPVPGAVYLHDEQLASFTPCSSFSPSQAKVFHESFTRSLFDSITGGASYSVTAISPTELELIVPVIDCQATASANDDFTSGKFFFLTRQRMDPDHVSVLLVYLSNQQYKITNVDENGAAAVTTLQLIDDMRATNVHESVHYVISLGYPYVKPAFRVYKRLNISDDGLMYLQLVRKPGMSEIQHTIQTACREGFFLKAESEQSNIVNYQWDVETSAALAVSRWRWRGKPVLHDSWAWVHGVQFFIGIGLLSSLVIMCMATTHKFRDGRPWIGDAFVSLTTSQYVYGAAVLVSWYINEFWCLREWAFATIQQVAEADSLLAYEAPMRADLIMLYLAICGAIGQLFRERVDPLVVAVGFCMGYGYRVSLLQAFASFRESAKIYADDLYLQNVSPRQPGQDKISPMSFWTTHPLESSDDGVILQALAPPLMSLVIPVAYIFGRKLHRFFYPDKVHVMRSSTATAVSENEQALLAQKRVLTLFEVAVGAQLEDRFGVLSDFETCVFIKGTKFASADGIYSTGFVIANKKYLLQTSDYWSIVLMKILRRRFRNIYVYDVSGSTVQQTARLVYPHTLTVQDLANVSVGILS